MYENPALDQSVAPPDPFGQADVLRLQRLHNGLSELQQQVDDGEIHPQEAEPLRQEILQQRAPLMMRQQAAQQAVQQQQMQQVMQQHALNEAMEQQSAQFRAQGLSQRVAPYYDPVTGKVAHLIEDGRGKVKEISFPDGPENFSPWHGMMLGGAGEGGEGGNGGEFDPEHPPSEGDLETQNQQAEFQQSKGGAQPAPGTPYQNPALDRSVPSPTPEEGFTGGGSGGASDFEGSGSGGAPEPQAAPAGQPGWKQGGWSEAEAATLKQVRAQLQQEREGGGAVSSPYTLSPTQVAGIHRAINASIPPAPPGHPHLELARENLVNRLTEGHVRAHDKAMEDFRAEKSRSTEAQRKEEVRQRTAETKSKEKDQDVKDATASLRHATDQVRKEGGAHLEKEHDKESGNAAYHKSTRPAWLKDPGEANNAHELGIHGEALRRAQVEWNATHRGKEWPFPNEGTGQPAAQPASQPAAGNTSAPTNKPAPVPKTKEERETEAKSVQAELDKRGAVEQQRVGANKAFDEQKAKTSSWIPRWLRMGE